MAAASVSLSPGIFHQEFYVHQGSIITITYWEKFNILYHHFKVEETEPQHVKASCKVGGEHQPVGAEKSMLLTQTTLSASSHYMPGSLPGCYDTSFSLFSFYTSGLFLSSFRASFFFFQISNPCLQLPFPLYPFPLYSWLLLKLHSQHQSLNGYIRPSYSLIHSFLPSLFVLISLYDFGPIWHSSFLYLFACCRCDRLFLLFHGSLFFWTCSQLP